ncbi:MAG: Y-family DNA polymerase [Patescibacteria group bacterium]
MPKVFALVDCNNFYASCERVFRPELEGKPVAVLSNNDGCIIARSNELKNAGIQMAAPYFKIKDQLEEMGTTVFSSNYALYGDMSSRVMQILREFTDDLEIYSIDEAFLDLTGFDLKSLTEIGHKIRNRVQQCTGIPVSIGIAPTKTLAKLANEIGKKDNRKQANQFNGVVNLVEFFQKNDTNSLENYLNQVEVRDIWGVGRQYAKKLNELKICTALDLKKSDINKIKKLGNINLAKTILELGGQSCIELEHLDEPKSVMSTRSFTIPLTNREQLRAVVSTYASRVSEKLRQKNCLTGNIMVFVHTNRFKQNVYFNSRSALLANPSNFTPDLIDSALNCLDQIFKPGLEYKKAGVVVWGIIPVRLTTTPLFADEQTQHQPRNKKLMQEVDKINQKYGRHTLKAAITNLKLANFAYQPQAKLNRYTTVWNEILEVKI